MKAIADEALESEVDFLRNLHSFNDMARKTIIRYVRMCKEVEYTYGQTVYAEGEIPKYVYIVKQGEFESVRKLPHNDTVNTPRQRGHGKSSTGIDQVNVHQNILAQRMPEIKDIPSTHRLNIF